MVVCYSWLFLNCCVDDKNRAFFPQFIFAGEVCSVIFLLFFYFDFTAKFYAFLIVRQTFFNELLECDLLEILVCNLS